jgi:hypothetical protein
VVAHHLHLTHHQQQQVLLRQEEVAIQLIQVKKLRIPGYLRGAKRKMIHRKPLKVVVVEGLIHLLQRKKRKKISFRLLSRRNLLPQLSITLNHKLQWLINNSNPGTSREPLSKVSRWELALLSGDPCLAPMEYRYFGYFWVVCPSSLPSKCTRQSDSTAICRAPTMLRRKLSTSQSKL